MDASVQYLELPGHLARMVVEWRELTARHDALNEFMLQHKPDVAGDDGIIVTNEEYTLMHMQLKAMDAYLFCLDRRMYAHGYSMYDFSVEV